MIMVEISFMVSWVIVIMCTFLYFFKKLQNLKKNLQDTKIEYKTKKKNIRKHQIQRILSSTLSHMLKWQIFLQTLSRMLKWQIFSPTRSRVLKLWNFSLKRCDWRRMEVLRLEWRYVNVIFTIYIKVHGKGMKVEGEFVLFNSMHWFIPNFKIKCMFWGTSWYFSHQILHAPPYFQNY